MTNELVLIFDFGSQFAQLIARRVRELNVFCQVVRSDITAERVKQLKPRGIILSGGPATLRMNALLRGNTECTSDCPSFWGNRAATQSPTAGHSC